MRVETPSGAALPVTAKLSRRFYDQLGDDVANELVNWFNAVDETYRNQLRELNELNWERFRSELRAEGVAIRAEMDKRFTALDVRFAAIDARFDAIEARFDAKFVAVEGRFSAVDARFAALEAMFPAFEERIEAKFDAKFDAKFAQFETRMFKLMFGFWTATIVPLAALILALNGVFQR